MINLGRFALAKLNLCEKISRKLIFIFIFYLFIYSFIYLFIYLTSKKYNSNIDNFFIHSTPHTTRIKLSYKNSCRRIQNPFRNTVNNFAKIFISDTRLGSE